MCDTCPTNNTIGLEFAQGDCGQCWIRGNGSWRAVPQFVYRKACEHAAKLTYQKQVDLLGPNNVKPIWTESMVAQLDMAAYIAKLEQESFCPWQDDWPEGAPWYFCKPSGMNTEILIRWQSPFANTQFPGISQIYMTIKVSIGDPIWRKCSEGKGVAHYVSGPQFDELLTATPIVSA